MSDSEPISAIERSPEDTEFLRQFNQELDRQHAKKERFNDTFPFGEGYAHVEIRADDLRRDFVAEAVQQRLDPKLAQKASTRIGFGFSDPDRPFHVALLDKIKSRLPQSWVRKLRRELGSVTASPDFFDKQEPRVPRQHCLLDVHKIVELIDEDPDLEDLPMEARQLALKQQLDGVWRHERQHLIQNCYHTEEVKALSEEADRREVELTKGLKAKVYVLGGTFAGSLGLGVASLFLADKTWPGGFSMLGMFFSTQLAENMAAQVYRAYRSSPKEVEAWEQNEDRYFRTVSPIKLEFENS